MFHVLCDKHKYDNIVSNTNCLAETTLLNIRIQTHFLKAINDCDWERKFFLHELT